MQIESGVEHGKETGVMRTLRQKFAQYLMRQMFSISVCPPVHLVGDRTGCMAVALRFDGPMMSQVATL